MNALREPRAAQDATKPGSPPYAALEQPGDPEPSTGRETATPEPGEPEPLNFVEKLQSTDRPVPERYLKEGGPPLWLLAQNGRHIPPELLPDHLKPIELKMRRARKLGEGQEIFAYDYGKDRLASTDKDQAEELAHWLPWLDNIYRAATNRIDIAYGKTGLENAFTVLNIRVRENSRTRQSEVSLAKRPFKAMRPRWQNAIIEDVATRFVFKGKGIRDARFSPGRFQTALDAILDECRVDPFKQWLEALPPWDGTERVDTLIDDCFTVDPGTDGFLLQHASQLLLLGPLTRTYQPGYKLDEMLVVSGPQGVGKSTLCEQILPPGIPDLFASGLEFGWDEKRLIEKIRGRAIVEVAELGGMTHSDSERLKMFLTSTADTVRLAYDREVSRIPRTCLFVGTTNNPEPLPNDPTGLRRWIVVSLSPQRSRAAPVRKYLSEVRDQLWAETLDMYRNGLRPELETDLAAVVAADNSGRRARDPFEERVAEMNIGKTSWPKSITEIGDQLGINVNDMRHAHRLGKALRNCGFVKRDTRVGQTVRKLWHPPELDMMDLL